MIHSFLFSYYTILVFVSYGSGILSVWMYFTVRPQQKKWLIIVRLLVFTSPVLQICISFANILNDWYSKHPLANSIFQIGWLYIDLVEIHFTMYNVILQFFTLNLLLNVLILVQALKKLCEWPLLLFNFIGSHLYNIALSSSLVGFCFHIWNS